MRKTSGREIRTERRKERGRTDKVKLFKARVVKGEQDAEVQSRV